MIKHMIKQGEKVSHTSTQSRSSTKIAREIKSNTLSRSLLSIHFSPPLATSYQKVQKCIVLNDSQAWSSGGGVERTPRTKAFDEVARAAGGGTGAVAAGADVVALVSVTGTAADLCPLGTLAKSSVVDLPFFSSTSS